MSLAYLGSLKVKFDYGNHMDLFISVVSLFLLIGTLGRTFSGFIVAIAIGFAISAYLHFRPTDSSRWLEAEEKYKPSKSRYNTGKSMFD